VRTPEQAQAIAKVADGVVIGSAIVELVAQHRSEAAGPVQAFVSSLAEAIHAARTVEA
jgi:tryptophan synthase alpha chain